MPFSYHYRNQSPSSSDDLLAYPLQEESHGDSIILSDLIRTGETSRLRRRGAMRIEPAASSSSRHHRWRSSPAFRGADDATVNVDAPGYAWTIVENRSRRAPRHLPMLEVSDDDVEFEDSDSDSGDEMVFSASFNRAISEQIGNSMSSESQSLRSRSSVESVGEKPPSESMSYTLVCGGPVDDTTICARSDPESVYSALASFILPQAPLPQSPSPPRRTSSESSDTNGCGVTIHTRAFPRYRHHQPMWTANTPATDVVVPLDKMYFDEICAKEKLSAKMMKQEACGCLRIGIGCAECGNPLGFRLTPCKMLRDHILSRQSHSRLRPGRSSSSTTEHSNGEHDLYLYTFFCNSTTSPQTSTFPASESTIHRRRDWSRSRPYPLLPPPPPLIRLMSDSEMSDSDEEVNIDFRTPGPSTMSSRILGGDLTASPESTVIRLEPNPTPPDQQGRQVDDNGPPLVYPIEIEEDSELGQARASWANVLRGVEATASSLGEEIGNQTTPSSSNPQPRRSQGRAPRRRLALGFTPERQLGLPSPNPTRSADDPSNPNPNIDIPSILLEEASMVLTPPPPEPHELEPSTLETDDGGQSTPRAAAWGMSFADGNPSTSFWGRPAAGSGQWTWSNELAQMEAEAEREREIDRERESRPRREFDPDGEFLEGLEGEWGEDMARQLGFSSVDEKSDGGETPVSGLWWP